MSGASSPTQQILIRPMWGTDIEDVSRIERQSFSTAWTAQAYVNELANPSAVYLVAEVDSRVVGFIGVHVVFDEAHVTNIAVDTAWRGRRIGDRLLCGMLLIARDRGVERATLEVRKSNVAAQNLYARYGFVWAAVRKNYYADTGEDADILWLHEMTDPNWERLFSSRRQSLGM